MTDEQKKALIKKLGAESNRGFDAGYDRDNREWFVEKIIDFWISRAVPDAKIEQKTNEVITASSVALNARIKKGFSSGTLVDKWSLYAQRTSRTQIIYGMIAMHPEFQETANADYFDFILERRFRSLQRMNFYVNPNKVQKIFDYPDPDKNPPEEKQVNEDAVPFWHGVENDTVPFILTDLGKPNPAKAVEILFNKQKDLGNRNLFDCDLVASTLHMDALGMAKNPNTLLKALAGIGDHYLKIDSSLGHYGTYTDGQQLVAVTSAKVNAGNHVDIELGKVGPILSLLGKTLTSDVLREDNFIEFRTVFKDAYFFIIVLGDTFETFEIDAVNPVTKNIRVGILKKTYEAGAKIYSRRRNLSLYSSLPYHFVTDSRPDHALFEQMTVKSTDFQVGDHVYVANHPLYRKYYPSGAWGGEHSFISEIGSRDSAAPVFRTTLKVGGHGLPTTTLLKMGDEMLKLVNTVLSILQALTKIHLLNLKTNGRNTTNTVTLKSKVEGTVNFNIFEYDVPYSYTLFREGKQNTIASGFVIKEIASDPTEFQIYNANGRDSAVVPKTPASNVFLGAAYIGTSFSTGQFTLSKWGVRYFNAQTARFETQPLFAKDNKTPKRLTFEDLEKSKPFATTDDIGIAMVTRPRVNFNTAYQAFLKSNGAI
jgi:hypothetical protein